MVGTHTDSPCLRVAPISKFESSGYQQLTVQVYGGPLLHTWFDRDLSLAGKVIIKDAEGKLVPRIWKYTDEEGNETSCLRISNLAIHLSKSQDFEPDREKELKPILSTNVIDQLMVDENGNTDKHPAALINAIARGLKCKPEDIEDFELNLIDTQAGALGGFHKEFIYSGRQDNLNSSLTTIDALIEAGPEADGEISLAMLFDHEEVGSVSAQGAASSIIQEIPHRIFTSFCKKATPEAYYCALRKSLFFSVDLNHAVHPNYPDKLQPNHLPKLNSGVLCHISCKQNFATDCVGYSLMTTMAEKAGVPIQEIMYRNDSMSGSTIGPHIASKSGIKTVDLGMCMMAAHSAREICGVIDLLYQRKLTAQFYKTYGQL